MICIELNIIQFGENKYIPEEISMMSTTMSAALLKVKEILSAILCATVMFIIPLLMTLAAI